MIKTLSKHGNSLALVIDRPILSLLKIDEQTPLDISTDGEVLIIAPVRDAKQKKRFYEELEKTVQQRRSVLKRLAE